MGTRTFVCPATGTEVSTGTKTDLATLASLSCQKSIVRTADSRIQMAAIQYWLTEVHLLVPTHDQDARAA
jgi:hypothetical protein